MLEKCLKKLGLITDIIFNIEKNYNDDTFYIILFASLTKIPKKYIFWQIEQTSLIDSPTNKFNSNYFNLMNNSLSIFEISPDNIFHYQDKIINLKKIIYNQLPFSDIYNTNIQVSHYKYDIVFFGTKCSRRSIILNKLIQNISRKYKIKCLFGINGKKRDDILKKTKYLLNIHYYKDAKLECDRFNIAINSNCLILTENCIGDIQNKKNYNYFLTYFDNINCNKKDANIQQLINVIEYNLKDEVFLKKKLNYINEKQNLENKCLSHLRKNLQSLNCFTPYLIKNTHFTDKN